MNPVFYIGALVLEVALLAWAHLSTHHRHREGPPALAPCAMATLERHQQTRERIARSA